MHTKWHLTSIACMINMQVAVAPAPIRRQTAFAAPPSARRTADAVRHPMVTHSDGAADLAQRSVATVKRNTAPLVQRLSAVDSESDEDWSRITARSQGKLSPAKQPAVSGRPVTARQPRATTAAVSATKQPAPQQVQTPSAAAASPDSSDDDWALAKLHTKRCCFSAAFHTVEERGVLEDAGALRTVGNVLPLTAVQGPNQSDSRAHSSRTACCPGSAAGSSDVGTSL